MLTLADGLTLSDVKRVVRAVGLLHHPRKRGTKAAKFDLPELQAWRGLPWGTSISGFAIAEKLSSHAQTNLLGLRIYVRRKVGASRLDNAIRIPPAVEVRKGRDRILLPTDVVEMATNPIAQRELSATSSIGSFTGVTEGTFGLTVIDRNDRPFALTCSHVVLPWFRKKPQVDPTYDAIESPADRDGQPGPNTIGSLYTWTPLVPEYLHTCDAALVRPADGVILSNRALQLDTSVLGSSNLSAFREIPRRRVQTFTRRKVLSGTVQSVHNTFPMTFLGKTFYFKRAVEVLYDDATFEGDSGAAVIQTNTRRVLGLHFAALAGTGTGYYIPIQEINAAFRKLGLRTL